MEKSMHEYSQKTKCSNNIASIAAATLFIGGLIFLAFVVVFTLPYEGVYQSISILLLTLSLLILNRYKLKSFLYCVKDTGSGYDLTVTEIKGKTSITICRVSLSNIEQVERINDKNSSELKSKAKEEHRKIFSYSPDIAPKDECWVFVTECDEPYLLKLCADDTLFELLRLAQKENEATEKNDTVL